MLRARATRCHTTCSGRPMPCRVLVPPDAMPRARAARCRVNDPGSAHGHVSFARRSLGQTRPLQASERPAAGANTSLRKACCKGQYKPQRGLLQGTIQASEGPAAGANIHLREDCCRRQYTPQRGLRQEAIHTSDRPAAGANIHLREACCRSQYTPQRDLLKRSIHTSERPAARYILHYV